MSAGGFDFLMASPTPGSSLSKKLNNGFLEVTVLTFVSRGDCSCDVIACIGYIRLEDIVAFHPKTYSYVHQNPDKTITGATRENATLIAFKGGYDMVIKESCEFLKSYIFKN